MPTHDSISHPLHAQHQRTFATNRFVYPVLSRRSSGISIGVNLNPDKICNFDCIYCQVDRTRQSETRFVELDALLAELDHMLAMVASGEIYATEKFRDTPPALRRLNDLAFSGDGEPTTYKNFDEIVARCAEIKRAHKLDDVKMVLITNASMFHRPHVQRGLAILDANQGEIWAKLEAGTDEYYQLVERTPIPFRQILDNITAAARARPLVIQSLFMRINGEPPSPAEQEAFCDRLNEITAAGGKLKLVQIYTVARRPAESFVTPLGDAEVDRLASLVRERTGLTAAGFYSVVSSQHSEENQPYTGSDQERRGVTTIQEAVQLGIEHHRAGRLQQAEEAYRQVLAAHPQQPDALHLLGLVELQFGRHAAAQDYIGRAIALRPQAGEFHAHLGRVFQAMGQFNDALACYHLALELSPRFVEAHVGAGMALKALGQPHEAVACYRQALELQPNQPEILNSLGNALQESGQLLEAVACFEHCLRLKPNFAEGHNNFGNTLQLLGRFEQAIAEYRQAIDQRTAYANAHNNLGQALQQRGEHAAAMGSYGDSLRIEPDYPNARYNRSLLLLLLGNFAEGWDEYESALAAQRHAARGVL